MWSKSKFRQRRVHMYLPFFQVQLRSEKFRKNGKVIPLHFFISLLWVFTCCKQVTEVPVTEPCTSTDDLVTIVAIDTLKIEVPPEAFPFYNQLFLKDNILYCLKDGSYRLDLYNLEKRSFYRSIQLDPNFVNNLGAFYVHSEDSIFITQELTEVLLLNDQGIVVDRFDLGNAPVKWTGSFDMPEYFFYSHSLAGIYFNSSKKLLTVTLTSPEIWHYKNRANFQMHGTYDITRRVWVNTFGYLPGYYQQEGIALPFILSNPYCLVVGDTNYVTFPVDPNIYVFDAGGQLIRSVCAEGKLPLPQPYDYDRVDDLDLERNFLLENGWYGKLNYHSALSIFTRTYVLPSGHATGSDSYSSSTGIVFLDRNLNKIGDYIFEKSMPFSGVGGEGYSKGFATPVGFIGSFKPEYYTNDDQLRYAVRFIITKK